MTHPIWEEASASKNPQYIYMALAAFFKISF